MKIDNKKINKISTKELDIFKPNKKFFLAMAKKDKFKFNKMMIDFYNDNSIEKSIGYLTTYYMKQNKHLVV